MGRLPEWALILQSKVPLYEGDQGRFDTEGKGKVKTKTIGYTPGFEDRVKVHEPRNATLEFGNYRETDSSLDLLERLQPC